MSRGGILVACAIVLFAVVGAAAWYFVLRDPTEPVDVEEAVTSFRTETGPSSGGASPISEGVYVYETDGFERTSALTGTTHRYPNRSTITVRAADCGMRLLWQVLDGRSTEWTYCVTDGGWELASQDERHTFFGATERTTYNCEDTHVRPRHGTPARWSVQCSTDDAKEAGAGRFVGRERVRVGEASVTAEHIRKRTRLSGRIRGFAEHDLWFAASSGVPVRLRMVSRTTNDSPVGEVRYDEDVTLVLVSLEPRR